MSGGLIKYGRSSQTIEFSQERRTTVTRTNQTAHWPARRQTDGYFINHNKKQEAQLPQRQRAMRVGATA